MKQTRVLLSPETKIASTSGPPNVAYYLSKELEKQVRLSYYPSLQSAFQNVSFWKYGKQLLNTWVSLFQRSYDIEHFVMSPVFINGSYPFALFANAIGLPLILNIHGIVHLEQPFIKKNLLNRAKVLAHKAEVLTLCRRASRIVVNSKYTLQRLVSWYNVSPEKIVIIPNGVNLTLFQTPSTLNEKVELEGDPCVLYVGSFSFSKGAETLIRSIAIVKHTFPRVKLHVLGDSESINPLLKSMIAKKGLEKNIIFQGKISQRSIPNYYKAADFCVFPSTFETFGIVILEAMASGTPIIASDIESFRELVVDETTALFFQCNDPVLLSEAILRLASDSSLQNQLSKNALEAVKDYEWKKIALRYVELYSVVLGSSI